MSALPGVSLESSTNPLEKKAAKVHVLIIATSVYQAGENYKFKDLPGTALAAARLAAFARSNFNEPRGIERGTVRVCLTPGPGLESQLVSEIVPDWVPASRHNVEELLDAWANDCDESSENVAILYIGGHGVRTTSGASWSFLGSAPRMTDPYRDALNLRAIRKDMRSCRAEQCYFLFDACALTDENIPPRTSSSGITLPPWPTRPKSHGGKQSKVGARQLTICARPESQAFIVDTMDGPVMSTVLLPLLIGEAGRLVNSKYVVTKDRLSEMLMPRINAYLETRKKAVDQDTLVLGDAPPTGICEPKPPPNFNLIFEPDLTTVENPVSIEITEPSTGLALPVEDQVMRREVRVSREAGAYSILLKQDGRPGVRLEIELTRDRRIVASSGVAR